MLRELFIFDKSRLQLPLVRRLLQKFWLMFFGPFHSIFFVLKLKQNVGRGLQRDRDQVDESFPLSNRFGTILHP
jgi:hypothetical protein